MPRNKAYRKFQLTFNNPKEHAFEHETIRHILEEISGVVYWCMCDEEGSTYHTHLYVAFENAKEFSMMQRRFYGAHIEAAKGTHRENRDYIRKEGKWRDSEKSETNKPETFEESGELPEESDRHVKQSEIILAMLENAATNAEIIRECPNAMLHLPRIEQARQTLLEETYRKTFRKLKVEYIWGETGVGKTRKVMELYGYENVFRVTNYAHPFDGYSGQDVIVFDEFRSSLPLSDMLCYLDGYPLMLPCRYADRVACYMKVYILSNIPLEKQYPNVQLEEPASFEAFKRRITSVCQMQAPLPNGKLF